MRIGHGFDVHRLVEDRPLRLGGVTIPHPRGLAGHSDGDVLLHAIIDAMLGAAAAGDIGAMFPSSDERWRGADSLALLHRAHERVVAAGFHLANLDATVVAEEPVLRPHVHGMRQTIAGALNLDLQAVSVKAKTTDRLGLTGRREGIAAFAVVLLE